MRLSPSPLHRSPWTLYLNPSLTWLSDSDQIKYVLLQESSRLNIYFFLAAKGAAQEVTICGMYVCVFTQVGNLKKEAKKHVCLKFL